MTIGRVVETATIRLTVWRRDAPPSFCIPGRPERDHQPEARDEEHEPGQGDADTDSPREPASNDRRDHGNGCIPEIPDCCINADHCRGAIGIDIGEDRETGRGIESGPEPKQDDSEDKER